MLESTQYAAIKLHSFVKSFYNTPRFGHSKDISYYFSDESSVRGEYFNGLIVVFLLIMLIAALWFIVLIILRILGTRVGCASGNAATIPAESMMSKGSYSVNTDETGEFIVMQADQNRVNRTRIVYFISGLYSLVSCGVIIYALFRLMTTLTSHYDAAEEILEHVDSTKVESLLTTSGEFTTLKDALVTNLSGFCSGAGVTVNGYNPATTTLNYESSLSEVTDISGDGAWALLKTDVSDLNKLMQNIVDFLKFVDGPASIWFIVTASVSGLFLLFCIYMLACAWKAGKEGYQFVGEDRKGCCSVFLQFIVTPLFALLIATSWFMTSVFFTSQVANADFCYDEITTGDTVLRMLVQRGYAESSDAYVLVDEYLHGCDEKNATPNALVNTFEDLIQDVVSASSDFQAMTPNDDITDLEGVCGAGTSDIVTESNTAIEKLNELQNNFNSVQESMTCETMAPILQGLVYETHCSELTHDLIWAFISGLTVSFFGTVMLTLRSSTLRPQIYIMTPNPGASHSEMGEDDSFGL